MSSPHLPLFGTDQELPKNILINCGGPCFLGWFLIAHPFAQNSQRFVFCSHAEFGGRRSSIRPRKSFPTLHAVHPAKLI